MVHSKPNVKILHPYKQYVRGSFKNGKLHGLIQVYGKMSVDPKGHCSEKYFDGLSFIGWFEEGKPTGPCWRYLVGGTYIYGVVDNRGEFTGSNDIAFIYQDLELALVGEFNKGIMVISQSITITKISTVLFIILSPLAFFWKS